MRTFVLKCGCVSIQHTARSAAEAFDHGSKFRCSKIRPRCRPCEKQLQIFLLAFCPQRILANA